MIISFVVKFIFFFFAFLLFARRCRPQSGNANFFYVITLLYGVIQHTLISGAVYAALVRLYKVKHRMPLENESRSVEEVKSKKQDEVKINSE